MDRTGAAPGSALTPEIRAAAARISPHHLRFVEFAVNDPRGLQRAHFQAIAEPHCCVPASVQSWPAMVQGETLAEMERASVGVYRLIKKIPQTFFDFDAEAMSDFYHLKLDFIRHFVLCASDPVTFDGLFGRGDFVLGMDRLWCVEFNMATNVGGIWESLAWQPQMTSIPVIAEFLGRHKLIARVRNVVRRMMTHIIRHALRNLSPTVEELSTAYVFGPDSFLHESEYHELRPYLDSEYQLALRELAPHASGSFLICGFADLEASGNSIFCGERPIHILLEATGGDVPTRFLRRYNGQSFTMHNGPVTYVLCNKLNLALLSEFAPSGLFNDEEQEFISRHIPWTRKVSAGLAEFDGVTVDLPGFILENREQLVLKKSISSSGHDVFVGAATSAEEWKAALATTFEHQDWIVQRYVPSAPFLFQHGDYGCAPHDAIWGLFVMNDEYAGAFLRVLPKMGSAVVNRSRGSMDGVVLEVSEGPVDDSWVSFDLENSKW